jgi:ABC-2 type transport system permease protein
VTPARVLRVVRVGWLISVKELTQSSFFILVAIIQPVIFASIAFFMVEAGGASGTLLYTALGAGLMGIWSATLFGSGGLIQWERYQGTLELLVAAPVDFVYVLLGSTLATSTIGIYSIGGTLVWGGLFFGVPFELAHPLLFVLAIPITVIGLGLLGLVLASSFVLYRHANALSNLLEYPVWLVTGLLVPVSLLPGWAAPLGWVLAPTWGIKTIRTAALGGDPVTPMLMTIALGAAYLVIGAVCVGHFERLSRERATLALT